MNGAGVINGKIYVAGGYSYWIPQTMAADVRSGEEHLGLKSGMPDLGRSR